MPQQHTTIPSRRQQQQRIRLNDLIIIPTTCQHLRLLLFLISSTLLSTTCHAVLHVIRVPVLLLLLLPLLVLVLLLLLRV
jgi:hypothetical protein